LVGSADISGNRSDAGETRFSRAVSELHDAL
jgi:hypothetical protein